MVNLIKSKFLNDEELRETLTLEGREVAALGMPFYRFLPEKAGRVGYLGRFVGSMSREEKLQELALIRHQRSTFKVKMSELNAKEFRGMERTFLKSLKILKETQKALSTSGLDVKMLDSTQIAFDEVQGLYEHALSLTAMLDQELPAYLTRFDLVRFEENMLSYLRGAGSEVLYGWVAATMRDNAGSFHDYSLGKMEKLSDLQIKTFTQLGNMTVLIEGKISGYGPSFFRALEIREGYLKVPLTALPHFERGATKDFIPTEGLTDSDIEAITVLHGGAAYQSFETAATAAINLR